MLQITGEGSGIKQSLSQLLLDAQAAALEPSKWEHIVSQLRNLVVPAGGAVILHATEPGRLVGLFQAGLDPAAVASYISNFATDNPWLHAQRQNASRYRL